MSLQQSSNLLAPPPSASDQRRGTRPLGTCRDTASNPKLCRRASACFGVVCSVLCYKSLTISGKNGTRWEVIEMFFLVIKKMETQKNPENLTEGI